MGEGVQVDDTACIGQGKEGILFFAGHSQLGIVVVFYQITVSALGPQKIFLTFGGTGSDTAGIAVKGCHVEYSGLRVFQMGGGDPFGAQGKRVAADTASLINLTDLSIGGVFQSKGVIPAQQLSDEGVQIFGTGTDNDLLGAHQYAMTAGQIGGDGSAQLRAAPLGEGDKISCP